MGESSVKKVHSLHRLIVTNIRLAKKSRQTILLIAVFKSLLLNFDAFSEKLLQWDLLLD